MTHPRILLMAALIILLAFRSGPVAAGVAPVVCNDGQIPISIARAYRDMSDWPFSGEWSIQGWYTVSTGKCSEIGPENTYGSPAIGDQSLTFLAFAFTDSNGVWGYARVREPEMRQTGWRHFSSSKQELCVQNGAFLYRLSTSQGDPAKECDRGSPGYYRIPVSLEFDGDADEQFPEHHILHVSFGASDHAIPPGPQSSSSGSSSARGSTAAGDSGDSVATQLLNAVGQAIKDAGNKPASRSDIDASNAKSRAAMLQWVREDVAEYIEASKTGFEAYKSGEARVSPGYRMWDSSVKPALAKGCWVVQGATATTFSCLLVAAPDLNAMRSYYTQITEDVTRSLPGDWSADAEPPFGSNYPASKGYRSSSGAHGEVWLANAQSGGGYELHYQLVSAASVSRPAGNPPPANPVEDDPIGQGGFITPANR